MASDLKIYVGPKAACDHCGRLFTRGEIIAVVDSGGLLFCSEELDTCMAEFQRLRVGARRTLVAVEMAFRNLP